MLTINEGSAHYERVFQLMNWRRYEEAIAEAEEWIKSNPHNADAYGMLAQIYLKSDEPDKAMYWSEESLRYDAENTIAWFVRVAVLYARGEDKEFFMAVQEAQRIDPYESHYFFLKFNAFHKKGKLQQAREELNQALHMSPDNSLYLASDSYLHANTGDFEASRSSERAALLQNPENDQTFLYLAWSAEARGEYKKELEFLQNAVRLDPTDEQIRTEYVNSLQKKYWFYRIILLPSFLKKLKPWQLALVWMVAWVVFKPLIAVFIVLYILSHLTSMILVRVKVFGWRSIFQKKL